jgi:hypothetical protein
MSNLREWIVPPVVVPALIALMIIATALLR